MGLHVNPSQVFRLDADQAVTNSVGLVTMTGFTVAIAANQRIAFSWYGVFTLGATGGFRFQVTAPAGITDYNVLYHVHDVTTPTPFEAALLAQAAFTNASAVASDYSLDCKGTIETGATAGNITFDFAQNNATADAIIARAGCFVMAVLF